MRARKARRCLHGGTLRILTDTRVRVNVGFYALWGHGVRKMVIRMAMKSKYLSKSFFGDEETPSAFGSTVTRRAELIFFWRNMAITLFK
jgi:hypothetical protein